MHLLRFPEQNFSADRFGSRLSPVIQSGNFSSRIRAIHTKNATKIVIPSIFSQATNRSLPLARGKMERCRASLYIVAISKPVVRLKASSITSPPSQIPRRWHAAMENSVRNSAKLPACPLPKRSRKNRTAVPSNLPHIIAMPVFRECSSAPERRKRRMFCDRMTTRRRPLISVDHGTIVGGDRRLFRSCGDRFAISAPRSLICH